MDSFLKLFNPNYEGLRKILESGTQTIPILLGLKNPKEVATTKEKSRVISDVSHVYSHVISGDMNLDILPLEQARDATVSFRQRSIFSGPSELPILYRVTLGPLFLLEVSTVVSCQGS